ncbi:protein kinase [Aspergillus eucalypticola CBS 122712]|uniref:Protein kinase n=1 Tax=Aspergillus eucalypticola (strain CBS 122712 / IBT 29274) TaxID=1448314 RepID=A0A317VKT1_ASPEC|nr:protein kinase [Aspergillus eucalypticola CBS 122712]PWY74149.1 protein kinase [Aspergillus eucalypticola CBS 122712]
MTSLLRAPSRPLCFPTSGWDIIPATEILDEKRFDGFKKGQYYPYQVISKLGSGVTSTTWLARDLEGHRYVTLKVYTRDEDNAEEFRIYNHLKEHKTTALDLFTISRNGGDHHCHVQQPMWESFRHLLYRNPAHRFTEDLLKAGLMQIFLALDYLYIECKLVHTDIKSDNILQEIADSSILEAFTKAEMDNPSPRKFVNGAPVYASRRFELPKIFRRAVLSDFGSAVRGDEKQDHDVQPNVYRSPEVMLMTKWSYPVDIWNVGVVIWDLFEGKHMFNGNDPDEKGYSTRAHLAEVIGLIGPPPLDMLEREKRSHDFFTEDGKWKQCIAIPQTGGLEASENFMRGMLQWRPGARKTAKELLKDPWLNEQIE